MSYQKLSEQASAQLPIVDKFIEKSLSYITELQHPLLHILSQNMQENTFIAGGSCISIIDQWHQYTDVDVWVTTDKAQKHIETIIGALNFKKTGDLTNQIQNFSDDLGRTIQIMRMDHFDSLERLLSTFDITACKIGFDSNRVLLNEFTEDHIKFKVISFDGLNIDNLNNEQRIKTLQRAFKYAGKGYTIGNDEISRVMYKKGLEEQSVKYQGVTGPVLDQIALEKLAEQFKSPTPPYHTYTISPYPYTYTTTTDTTKIEPPKTSSTYEDILKYFKSKTNGESK